MRAIQTVLLECRHNITDTPAFREEVGSSRNSRRIRKKNCGKCRRVNTYSTVVRTCVCGCFSAKIIGKHSCRDDGSVCLGQVSASSNATAKAVNSPEGADNTPELREAQMCGCHLVHKMHGNVTLLLHLHAAEAQQI